MRVLVALVAVAAAFAVTPSSYARPADDAPPREPSCAVGGCARQSLVQDEPAERDLAERYAPIVYMKTKTEGCPRGKGDVYYPTSVDIVLGHHDVALHDGADGDAVVKQAPLPSDLYDGGEELYLDVPGDPHKPECAYEQRFKELALSSDPTVYAHVFRQDGRDELVLQYWLYFYFNDWNNNHESDWEFIQIVFEAASAEEALTAGPSTVIYSQHGGGERADWDDGKVRKDGDRPVVYVAGGSHAIQYEPGIFLGKGAQGTGFGCDDASGPSTRYDPAVELLPLDPSADDPHAWITYEGRWGQREHGEFNGPTGPNRKTPWTEPLTWQEKQRTSSVEVPEESIGPNAAKAFCGTVAFGSKLLFSTGPWVVLGLVVGLVGALTTTAVRTDFRPVFVAPVKARRKFGQIVSGALRLERRYWRLYLGIGVLFVPIGIVTSALQALLLGNPPLETVEDGVNLPIVSAAMALLIGFVQFAVAYWIVVTATIAATDALAEDREIRVFDAYRTVWRDAGALARARLRSLGIVALWLVSIVGIPMGVRQGVRWLFLEHAVLIEGTDAREARRTSEETVEGQFWRVFGATALIIAGAVLTGPVIGMALVLFTSAALGWINLLSSVFFMLFVPFSGIALTLLYYDLRLRRG